MTSDPDPSPAELHKRNAVDLRKKGQYDEALAELEKALALQPEFPAAVFNVAAIHLDQGRPADALTTFRKAIELKPDYHQAFTAVATCLRKLGRLPEAEDACKTAIRFAPDDPDAHATYATVLHTMHAMEQASREFEIALSLRPNDPKILNNFGNLLMDIDQPVRAGMLYRSAIAIDPTRAELFNNLGNMLKLQGEIDEAIECYRRTLQLKPDSVAVHSNLLLTLNSHPRSEEGLLPAHKEFAKRHAEKFYPRDPLDFPNDQNPDRRLRIGYVSPDFRRHSVAYFFEPILFAHNRDAVEVFCYSDVLRPDEVTARMKAKADGWREIAGHSDDQVDQMIRQDRIDILIDLAGHTGNNRMLVFARKPAPLQVTYLGYPNTTGLQTIEYRLTDAEADPQRTSDACTERLVRLPRGFLCYKPHEKSPVVRDLNVAGAGDFSVTFGSFNNYAKVTEPTLRLWAQILAAVPGARLVLKAESLSDPEVRQGLRATFAEVGGDPARLDPLGREPTTARHLSTYHRIDIALDTFPYNGTTTTCEAIWMGVPVITLTGRSHHARVGTSILTRVGLTGLIAKTPEEYVSIAVNLARDSTRRQQLSMGLRNRMRKSPLMDAPGFVKDLETAYRKMWQHWCKVKSERAQAPGK